MPLNQVGKRYVYTFKSLIKASQFIHSALRREQLHLHLLFIPLIQADTRL